MDSPRGAFDAHYFANRAQVPENAAFDRIDLRHAAARRRDDDLPFSADDRGQLQKRRRYAGNENSSFVSARLARAVSQAYRRPVQRIARHAARRLRQRCPFIPDARASPGAEPGLCRILEAVSRTGRLAGVLPRGRLHRRAGIARHDSARPAFVQSGAGETFRRRSGAAESRNGNEVHELADVPPVAGKLSDAPLDAGRDPVRCRFSGLQGAPAAGVALLFQPRRLFQAGVPQSAILRRSGRVQQRPRHGLRFLGGDPPRPSPARRPGPNGPGTPGLGNICPHNSKSALDSRRRRKRAAVSPIPAGQVSRSRRPEPQLHDILRFLRGSAAHRRAAYVRSSAVGLGSVCARLDGPGHRGDASTAGFDDPHP
ncbi:MAG: hypothetical protein BWZ10_02493 [candidate division BRC1 bacterium ADurb.BinA364]|nr:MAG: hypothetical protein BWZ10_02493 [candidate division BRC1 bacterium ADurb.BinA364]